MDNSSVAAYWNHILKWYRDALGWDKDTVIEYTMELFVLQTGPTLVDLVNIDLLQEAALANLIDIEIDEGHVYLLREPEDRFLEVDQNYLQN